ncbi:PD-(D/E)XK nuclease family protein [Capnocytophaga sputigena]|jgi:ankyrin repeat containing protein|uniref:PD-(D/E)XK nuclease family protein n=1 Tax=Capnocytophaga sputigena TaxID=1019 RepID=UPI002633A689|nr:PD-(D/E)XK nuclease family protein [Capnocytophaga sputigena]
MKIQELLNDFKEIKKLYYSEGNCFNFFQFVEDKFWKITETKHSRILAFFLNPEETHGQGGTFLKLFLDKLEFNTTDFNPKLWRVYVERNNIDILLQSDQISIVIENKSNGAENQYNQLYRYWDSAIYQFHHKDLEKAENKNYSRIVYLPDGWWYDRKPTEQTKKRPDYLSVEEYPEKLNENIITTWTYIKEINEWLTECANSVSETNIIKYFINSYITYWSKTKLKDKQYMQILKNHLDTVEDWKNLNEIINQAQNLKSQWIANFEKEIKVENPNIFWGQRKTLSPYDFRWGIKGSDWTDMCILFYPSEYGLSIWGQKFYKVKDKYKAELEAIFSEDFQWIEDSNSNYAMCLKDDCFEFDEVDLPWQFYDNAQLVKRIKEVITKYTNNPKVVELFKTINVDPKE